MLSVLHDRLAVDEDVLDVAGGTGVDEAREDVACRLCMSSTSARQSDVGLTSVGTLGMSANLGYRPGLWDARTTSWAMGEDGSTGTPTPATLPGRSQPASADPHTAKAPSTSHRRFEAMDKAGPGMNLVMLIGDDPGHRKAVASAMHK